MKDAEVEARVERRDRLAGPADSGRAGRKTRTSPRASTRAVETAEATRTSRGRGSGPVACLTSTGKGRPGTEGIGAGALPVGEEPRRRAPGRASRRRRGGGGPRAEPSRTSRKHREGEVRVAVRSWNSSSMTPATPGSVGSSRRRRVRIPSVTTRMRVLSSRRPRRGTGSRHAPDLFAQLCGEAPRGGPRRDPAGLEDRERPDRGGPRREALSARGRLPGAGRGEEDAAPAAVEASRRSREETDRSGASSPRRRRGYGARGQIGLRGCSRRAGIGAGRAERFTRCGRGF